jgi:hypothetical protein
VAHHNSALLKCQNIGTAVEMNNGSGNKYRASAGRGALFGDGDYLTALYRKQSLVYQPLICC